MKDAETKDLEYAYNLGLAVERLHSNKDFLLIMEDLSINRPSELTKLLSGVVKRNESTDTILEELKAYSFFQSYIKQLIANGNSAKESLGQEDY